MKRRDFIRISSFTAGAWILSDSLTLSGSVKSEKFNFSPDPLLRISESGAVTIFIMKQEMGQKVVASLPLIIAEELEIDPKDITVETLPYDVANAGNYTTWASNSISGSWMHLRKVGATAKMMLITAAATQWNVDRAVCKAYSGRIINTSSNEVLHYKDLIKAASALTPPANVTLKNFKNFKVIGQTALKMNINAVVTGKHQYTMDVKLPGMLYAALVRCPVYNGKVESFNTSALAGLAGFVKVLPVTQMNDALNRNAVAVIATNTWAALEAQRLLKVTWDYELMAAKDSKELTDQFKTEISTAKPARVFGKEQNSLFNPIVNPQVYEAVYEVPYLAHAAMEPMNCTAWYKDGRFEIWGGFQAPMFINSVLPKLFDVERTAISVNLMPMGGSFGRKEKVDNVADAMQLAKAMGVPVQMICSRVDDLQADFYRHASYHQLSAVATADEISQWRHQLAIATFPGKEISGPWHMLGGVTNDLCYATGEYQSAFYPVESPIPLGSWRSIAFSPNVFAIESFIDELAIRQHVDPVTFRCSLLKADEPNHLRLKNVLTKCADQIDWWNTPSKGRFRGIACCIYGHSGSCVAHAMEISVTKEKLIKIHKCVVTGDSDEPDHLIPGQADHQFRGKLTRGFRDKLTTLNV